MRSEPKTLRAWHAERSGGRMTVYGTDINEADPSKAVTKITNVDKIVPPEHASDHHVLAIDKDGVTHKLVFA